MLDETKKLIYLQEKEFASDRLVSIMRELAEASNVRPDGVVAIDDLLRDADPEGMGTETIITLLRFNFRARDILSHWKNFRDRSAVVVQKRGKDPQVTFRGLYTQEPAPNPYTDEFARMIHAISLNKQ